MAMYNFLTSVNTPYPATVFVLPEDYVEEGKENEVGGLYKKECDFFFFLFSLIIILAEGTHTRGGNYKVRNPLDSLREKRNSSLR